jgi:type I restriction enzyme S subunit
LSEKPYETRSDNFMQNLITKHLDIWTSAHKTRSTAGRGSNNKLDLVGIKKLRELILELAVRGKLVQQDPNDEPASELLKKIAAEKEKQIKNKVIKKTKTIDAMQNYGSQFEVPSNWSWVYLNDLGDWGAGATPSRSNSAYYGGDIPWFKSGELNEDFISQAEETVTELALKECSLRENKIGDILIAMYGATIGKSSILSIPATTNQAVCACTPFDGLYNRFLLLLLRAFKSRFIGMGAGGAQPNISREKIIATSVPLPPLPEQHRIVAKVDELMAFCDQLEQTQSDNIAAHAQLVEALLATLVQSGSTASRSPRAEGSVRGELVEPHPSASSVQSEFEENWQRIAAHFDTLFATEHSIDQLKQTILQLAVMGKLVPQNPNDEPASELLKKIAAEKAQLIKEGKIKKEKPLPEITNEEKPFELPSGWEWVKLDFIAIKSEAGWSPLCNGHPRTEKKWGVLKVSAVSWGSYNPDENKELPDTLEPRPEYEVKAGDFLISRANTAELVAKAVVVPAHTPEKLMMSDKIIRFNFSSSINLDFIQLVNNSSQARSYYSAVAGGTSSSMKNVSREQIRNLVFALPSLAEQHRIVTKVEELMTLCDSLKTNLQNAQTTQLAIADALVEQTTV